MPQRILELAKPKIFLVESKSDRVLYSDYKL